VLIGSRPPISIRAGSAFRRGYRAGCLEDDAPADLDGVVGEAFVEPSQKSDIDGGLHAVRPFLFFEQSEQVLVEWRQSIGRPKALDQSKMGLA
jgi:hypothetical protein